MIMTVLFDIQGAYAFTIYTAPTQDIDYINCSIVNVGNIALEVEFEACDITGEAINDQTIQLLDPGEVGTLTWSNDPAYCKFKVKAKNKRKTARKKMVRGIAVFYDGVYSYSSPAR
jgi:hypothetical protein